MQYKGKMLLLNNVVLNTKKQQCPGPKRTYLIGQIVTGNAVPKPAS